MSLLLGNRCQLRQSLVSVGWSVLGVYCGNMQQAVTKLCWGTLCVGRPVLLLHFVSLGRQRTPECGHPDR